MNDDEINKLLDQVIHAEITGTCPRCNAGLIKTIDSDGDLDWTCPGCSWSGGMSKDWCGAMTKNPASNDSKKWTKFFEWKFQQKNHIR